MIKYGILILFLFNLTSSDKYYLVDGSWKNNNPEARTIHPEWIVLSEMDQINDIFRLSRKSSVIIYKHSTRCGICYRIQQILIDNWDHLEGKAVFYYLDVIENRTISNKVAAICDVRHESPQVLVLKNGKVVYAESHYNINIETIQKCL